MIPDVFFKYGCIPRVKLPISCLYRNVVFVSKSLVESEFNRAMTVLPLSHSFAKTLEM